MNELQYISLRSTINESATLKYLEQIIRNNLDIIISHRHKQSLLNHQFEFRIATQALLVFQSKTNRELPQFIHDNLRYTSQKFMTMIDKFTYKEFEQLFEFYPTEVSWYIADFISSDLCTLCLLTGNNKPNLNYSTVLLNINSSVFNHLSTNYRWLHLETLRLSIGAPTDNTIINELQALCKLKPEKQSIDDTEHLLQARKNLDDRLTTNQLSSTCN
jgi:competence CoiA-like predicted nuclease